MTFQMLLFFIFSFMQFIEISGGLMGGSDPPAFQNSEKERLAKPSVQVVEESLLLFNHTLYE